MPSVNCSPFGPKPQIELAAGTPAVGYKLFFYVAGSVNTKQNTYTDSTGGVANTNPLVLNSLGQPVTEIWFTAGQAYKVVLAPSTDTDPPTSPVWSVDNLRGINDTSVTIDQWVSGPSPTYIGATQFSLVGDQTSTFHVGRRVKCTVTAGTVYGTITVSAFAAVTTITLAMDSTSLDSGLSAVSYGLLSAVNTSTPKLAMTFFSMAAAGRVMGSVTAGTAAELTPSSLLPVGSVLSGGAVGHCRLSRASASSLLLSPTNGNLLTINGQAYAIPDAGVTLAAAPAASNTTYYIYAYMSGATMTLEASTTTWALSTTAGNKGTPIKTGDDTRTLIGMARGNGSTQWADSVTERFVLNYWQRRSLAGVNAYTANRTTASATYVVPGSSEVCSFLTWADEAVIAASSGNIFSTAAPQASMSFDGSTTGEDGAFQLGAGGSANNDMAMSFVKSGLSEGYHTLNLLGLAAGAATVTFLGSGTAGTRTGLSVGIRG